MRSNKYYLDETALETPLCSTGADFSILIFEEVSLQSFLHSSKLFLSCRYRFLAEKNVDFGNHIFPYVFRNKDIDSFVEQHNFCNNSVHAMHVPNNHSLIYIFEMKQVFRLSLSELKYMFHVTWTI